MTFDRIFACIYLLVGYAFVYVMMDAMNTSALSIFTIFYAAVVLLYLRSKNHKPPKESWFWLIVMLAIGIPFAFWTVLYVFQMLALMAIAAYWTLSATGHLLAGVTSQWFFFDGGNALFAVPFGNFSCQTRVLLGSGQKANTEEDKTEQGTGLSILLGLLLVIPALIIILPLLSSADAGFEHLAGNIVQYIQDHLLLVLIRIIFAIPVSCYLFGLIFGGIHSRKTDTIQIEKLQKTGKRIRRIPNTTICTALGILCIIYLIFIGLQGNYLFSAFAGTLPQNFTYAEYARRGFFELCQIGAWNLIILWGAGLFSRKQSQEHLGQSILVSALSALTLILIVTAMSKLGMYISVYGLTVNRILPMVFLIWMALAFVCIIARQKKIFPMARICVMAGAVLFCLLCVFPLEKWIWMYNTWARMQGYIL